MSDDSKPEECDNSGGDCGACDKEGCTSRPAMQAAQTDLENDDWMLAARLERIKHAIVVLSGKGGVGKSTVAVNLAVTLALSGKRVGLLDVDIHGPSIPTMLGIVEQRIESDGGGIIPARVGNLLVVSIGLLLKNRDDAVIWRGPMKATVIRQFIADVNWGELDYLVVDCPPGTGDEPLSVCQLLGKSAGAVVVTTPQEVAAADVRKSVNFCLQLGMPVMGVVENMSGFVCPSCGSTTDIFRTGGGKNVADTFRIPFLGRIPIDPAVSSACDDGTPFVSRFAGSPTAEAFARIASQLISPVQNNKDTPPQR
jgi:ATP-binding protein involved in chromosome partitioning